MYTRSSELKPLQTKTIAKICRAKIEDWAKSVRKAGNEEIANIISTKTMITGGALVSLLSGEPVNDYDIYFRDKESTLRVAAYYVELFKLQNEKWMNGKVSNLRAVEEGDRVKIRIKSSGVVAATESPTEYQYFEGTQGNEAETFLQNLVSHASKENLDYAPVFISDNAITLSNEIQVVIRFFGEPDEIHKNYDFVHCTNIYCSWDGQVKLNAPAMESIRTKNLSYVGSLYPICSILRLRKFIARGWKINAGQVLKIVWQIKDLDLDSIEVLSEQLIGVDAAYFSEMINLLRADKASGKTIDQTYIMNLIDIVFEQ